MEFHFINDPRRCSDFKKIALRTASCAPFLHKHIFSPENNAYNKCTFFPTTYLAIFLFKNALCQLLQTVSQVSYFLYLH